MANHSNISAESDARQIPSVMFSQHPDHAQAPYWYTNPFIETHHELEECYRMFSELGAEEMMWDWEGKLVDESVVERLLGKHFDFFSEKPLGKELFLTFRVPNPRIESGYRLGRAFMIVLSSHHVAHNAQLTHPPLFEVILPMTESAGEMIDLQQSFHRISKAATDSFGSNSFSTDSIEVIPIFESVDVILRSGDILREYLTRATEELRQPVTYLRPFCARSDPALNSGIVPTTLAIKWAISEYSKVERETNIPLFPIIAPGSLPFRGGLTPESAEEFITEYAGIRTIVIQSAFRYDFPLETVKAAIKKIADFLPAKKPVILENDVLPEIQAIIPLFETPYKQWIEHLAPIIGTVSPFIPPRRERVQHIGLFGYSRTVGKITLPRAIGFTASCYSLGLPPELFGTGVGVAACSHLGQLPLVEKLYKNLKPVLRQAGHYLRKQSIQELGLTELVHEVDAIEEYLGEALGPQTDEEIQHAHLVSLILETVNGGHNPQQLIEQAAILRHSLG